MSDSKFIAVEPAQAERLYRANAHLVVASHQVREADLGVPGLASSMICGWPDFGRYAVELLRCTATEEGDQEARFYLFDSAANRKLVQMLVDRDDALASIPAVIELDMRERAAAQEANDSASPAP